MTTRGKTNGVVAQGWIQTIVTILSLLSGLWLAGNTLLTGISTRLSVLEAKVEVALKGQGDYQTKSEAQLMNQNLQLQINELKEPNGRRN